MATDIWHGVNDRIPTFDYFVVRLNRTDARAARITGLVERLGSGEKHAFDTAEHLTRLLSTWTAPGAETMQPHGKREDKGAGT